MPHQCTNCGHVFDDGSKEMLSGCPDCGGNKFQYHPNAVPEEPPADAEPPERDAGSVTGAVGRAANKVRDAVTGDDTGRSATESDRPTADLDAGTDSPPETEGVRGGSQADAATDATESRTADEAADTSADSADAGAAAPEAGGDAAEVAGDADSEDTAQATARSEVVDRNSLPDPPEGGRVVKEPDSASERPDLESLREELNDQFESIRIVAPGEYELNLMELYDRQEYIIALQENGRYVIEVPDAWDAPDPTDK